MLIRIHRKERDVCTTRGQPLMGGTNGLVGRA